MSADSSWRSDPGRRHLLATAATVVALVLAVAVVQTLLVLALQRRAEATVAAAVDARIADAAAQAAGTLDGCEDAALPAAIARIQRTYRLEQALVVDGGGRLLADAGGGGGTRVSGLVADPAGLRQALAGGRPVVGRPLAADGPTRMVYAPVMRGGRPWAVLCLELADPLPGVADGLRLPLQLAVGIGLAAAAATAAALLLALRATARSRRRLAEVEGLARTGALAAAIAHEVKNPLGSVVSASQLLGRSPHLDGDDLVLVRQIEDEARRADDELNGYLDLVREMPLRRTRVGLEPLIQEVLASLRVRAERAGVVLEAGAEAGLEVPADRRRLRQALVNLVLNAIEAQQGGGTVWVAAARRGGLAEITVADKGPGIPPALADRLFRPFATSKPDGTGLGLSVARRTCERHGGTLVLAPSASGATFALRLPLSTGEDPCAS